MHIRISATNAAGRVFTVAYTNVAGYNYGYTISTPNGDTIRRGKEEMLPTLKTLIERKKWDIKWLCPTTVTEIN